MTLNTLRQHSAASAANKKPRRSSSYLIASIGLHVVAGVLLLRFLISPNALLLILGGNKSAPVPVERIGFLRLPKATAKPVVGRSGGDNRPVTKTPPVKLVAPTEV